MAARYQAELADQLGNLASRITAMVVRYRGGSLPEPVAEPLLAGPLSETAELADERMRALDFSAGLTVIMEFVRRVNGYVTESQPWVLAKDEGKAADLDRVLYATADGLRAVAVLLAPVLPKACATLWQLLGAEASLGPLAQARVQDAGRWGQLPAGAPVSRGEPLFPRLEERDT
jgi:methionyl-tRNA synthetase